MIDVKFRRISDDFIITTEKASMVIDSDDLKPLIQKLTEREVDRYYFLRALHEGYH